MPLILLLITAYLAWRFWKKHNRNDSERLRILEARVRLLEERLDQALHGSTSALEMDTRPLTRARRHLLDVAYSDAPHR
jgi:hypothetical protein